MAKVTLEFVLPEEEGAFKLALKSPELYSIVTEMKRIIRSHKKYERNLEDCFEEIESEVNSIYLEDIP